MLAHRWCFNAISPDIFDDHVISRFRNVRCPVFSCIQWTLSFFIYSYFSFSLEYYAVLGIDRRSTTKGLMYSFSFVHFYLFAILRIVFSILLLSGIPCRPVFLSFYVKLLIQIQFFSCLFFQATFLNIKNHLLTKGLSNSQCGLGKFPSGLELFLQHQSVLSLCSSCFVS